MELFNRYLDYLSEVEEKIITHAGELGMRFFNGRAPQKVLSCDTGLADRHRGGRMTLIVTTDAGRLMYKPHSLRTDLVAGELLAEHFSDVVRIPEAIDCGDCGFCRFVENRPADNAEDAARYFRNLGGVAAIARALGSGDLLMENFLAEGPLPVLVDPELILTPGGPMTRRDELSLSAFERSCMEPLDASLLLGVMNGAPTGLLNCAGEENRGLPVVGGVRQTPFGNVDEILKGFSEVYGRCTLLREEILRKMRELKGSPVRVLVRGTRYYHDMIAVAKDPRVAGSESGMRRVFAGMSRLFDDRGIDGYGGILELERQAILTEEIPYFTALPESRDLCSGGVCVFRDFYAASMLENLERKLGRLCEEDRRFVSALIERNLNASPYETEAETYSMYAKAAPVTEGEAAAVAERILHRCCAELLETAEGDCGFLGPDYGSARIRPLGPGLAMGAMGPALFDAAAARVLPEHAGKAERIVSAALKTAEAYVGSIENGGIAKGRLADTGIFSGAAGVLEGLLTLSELGAGPKAEELAGRLRAAAGRLDFAAVKEPGVYNGLSGLVLALCDRRNAECDAALVARIAESLTSLMESGRVRPLSGYGNGMAGIGTALLAAYGTVGGETLRRAAEKAFSFEHEAYREDLGTWPDLRRGAGRDAWMQGICSGAPGIAIAMDVAARFGVEHAAEDRERAIEAMRRRPLLGVDYLCCGNAAIAESLLCLKEYAAASRVLGAVAERMERAGGPVTSRPGYRSVFSPGLLFGWSGIGYTFLDFAFPEKLPPLLPFGGTRD